MRVRMLRLAVVIGAVSLVCGAGQRYRAEPGQGDDWLRWDKETRKVLVYAYITGYRNGSVYACNAAQNVLFTDKKYWTIEELPFMRCLDHVKEFSRPHDYYIEKLSKFYEAYPEHKDIPARLVLRELDDSEDKSVEKLHELFQLSAISD